MIAKKTWSEFSNTGLLLFINQILHLFGWSICIEIDRQKKQIKSVFPARVSFRGFKTSDVHEAYKKATYYLLENSSRLLMDFSDNLENPNNEIREK